MGWSIGYDSKWKRDVGYGVPAKCDHPGCDEEIDRGLTYVCGSDAYGGDYGCGLFFCEDHLAIRDRGDDTVMLCSRCRTGHKPAKPKPDVKEWVEHKLTDESWAPWRAENEKEVLKLKDLLKTYS